MAVTLKHKVELYTGFLTDSEQIDNVLNQAAAWVVRILPDRYLDTWSTESVLDLDLGQTLDVKNKRVTSVFINGFTAEYVDRGVFYRSHATPGSILTATSATPHYTFIAGSLDVSPKTGLAKVYAVAAPTLTNNLTSISGFPREAETLVVLWTAIQFVVKALLDKLAESEALGLTIGNLALIRTNYNAARAEEDVELANLDVGELQIQINEYLANKDNTNKDAQKIAGETAQILQRLEQLRKDLNFQLQVIGVGQAE
jgi:hypothetical protein